MKMVGFSTKEGLRLGVVEGEEVIDLQAVDQNVPTDLGEWLRRNNGDLTPIKALAERAWLLWKGRLLAWSPGGYREQRPTPKGLAVEVLTPASTVASMSSTLTRRTRFIWRMSMQIPPRTA